MKFTKRKGKATRESLENLRNRNLHQDGSREITIGIANSRRQPILEDPGRTMAGTRNKSETENSEGDNKESVGK